MKRKTIVLLLIGLLLSLTLSLYSSSASAHTSTYCGHGHSGFHIFGNNVTHYAHSHPDPVLFQHIHGYNHYNYTDTPAPGTAIHSFRHHIEKYCNGTH